MDTPASAATSIRLGPRAGCSRSRILIPVFGAGLPSVGVQLDTFHMNIEESDMAEAIRLAGPRLKHFHAVENNRGVPGTGQVPWADCFAALNEVGYDDLCVFEFFPVDLPVMARRTHTWRQVATSEEVAVGGKRRLSAFL
ncbi:sugar phosphate isomerase/epimerase family protein [Micromonospora sp. NPDC048830]|uniref:sugar phosphate isomerase/epimerase family protein n=1 Tax=Micromonospora sp. NPDC048830 TaxID=3364257 RepID=UPI003718A125